MGTIVIELTNRCNLTCRHCFTGRHGGNDDLPLAILERVFDRARAHGFEQISYTGGDPTVHRRFLEVIRSTVEAGYDFGMVTNGWNFSRIHVDLLPFRDRLRGITFSLDGASESTHDELRGQGSFRRVMQAMSACVAEELPFTINMVIGAHNRHEIARMAGIAPRLGSRGVRFAHLMPSPLTTARGFDLAPQDRKLVEAEIRGLGDGAPIPVVLGPGYHTTELFPCAPLRRQEFNIDCHGNVTTCCHLSGHGEGAGRGDIVGSLHEIDLDEALSRLDAGNAEFHAVKRARLADGRLADEDFFHCWYCSRHYDKVGWLREVEGHPWGSLLGDS